MPVKPIVTVLMPVYNGQKYIRKAIDSILLQTFINYELLIINDGSTDDSSQIIESYSDPRIRLVHNQTNLRLIKTLNKGVKLARGQYIARMDCDDISMPERLAKQVAFMDAYPEVGVLGTSACVMDTKGKTSYKVMFPLKHQVIQWGLFFGCPICHPTTMIRRDVLVKVSGYDPVMLHAEDYDLWYRLSKITKLANLSDILLYLRKHGDSVCSTNMLLHTKNAVNINKRISSELLREDIDTSVINCIRSRRVKSWEEQVKSVQLIERLRKEYVAQEALSNEEKKMVSIDAANRIIIISLLRFYDLRSFRLLALSLRLDGRALCRLVQLLVRRYIPVWTNTRI